MAIRLLSIILSILFTVPAFSQGTIRGRITEANGKDPLVGVTVKVNDTTGTISDSAGNYSVTVPAGRYKVTYSFLSLGTETRSGNIKQGETKVISFSMQETNNLIDQIVVSGSKSERKLSEEPVTIDVVKGDLMKNSNNITLADAVDKITGVEIFDNQVTIRGGSGYSFGAGSRVLLLVDDMPLLTVDRGEIKWDFIPMEIIDQVEISKSAASALYGAGALNGTINVRTGFAKDKPETEVSVYYQGYGKPRNAEAAWWKLPDTHTRPMRYGATIFHKKRIKQFDIVASADINRSNGFIRLLDTHFERLTVKLRYRSKKIPGLSCGLMANFMESKDGDYIYWQDAGAGAFIPSGSTNNGDIGSLSMSTRATGMIDAWVNYYDNHDGKHMLRTRYNHVYNIFGTNNSSFKADWIFGEYQYNRKFKFGLSIVAGTSGEFYNLNNPGTFGLHHGNDVNAYAQVDYKIGRFNMFIGGRYEHLMLDTTYNTGRPVASAGLNFKAGKASFLRASFGQGYRFPSIAERFVDATQAGVHVFPNPSLLPEYGFNAEVGLKQGFQIGGFKGYFDASMFWMEYWEMTEFTFGVYVPDSIPPGHTAGDYVGFKAQNVSRARIAGFELSLNESGKIGKMPIRWQAGYTYNYGVDLNKDSTLVNGAHYLKKFFQSVGSTSPATLDPMLKYRSRHIFKNDVEVDLWRFTIGVDVRYYSFVEKLDPIFEAFIPGLNQFRVDHGKGSTVLNLRAAYNFNKYGRISLIVNNALNSTLSIRPARMDAPINFVVQYRITI